MWHRLHLTNLCARARRDPALGVAVTGEVPTVADLRARARQHRERAQRESDQQHRKALLLVADEYDKLADELDALGPGSH